jgi:anti-sigma B factor antagonist
MAAEILRVRELAGVTVAGFVEADLDSEAKIHAAGDRIAALLEGGRTRLLLDFDGVRYVGSAMLGKLIALHRRAAKAGGRVVLCGMSPYLRTIFEVARMDRVLTIRHDEEDALPLFGVEAGGRGDVTADAAAEDAADYVFDEDSPRGEPEATG